MASTSQPVQKAITMAEYDGEKHIIEMWRTSPVFDETTAT